jgi:hypothetical protein
MTPKQTALYWREWAAAKRARGLEDSDRHFLHSQALGYAASSKAFTNAELDKVLGIFRAYSRPGDLGGQLRQLNQQKTRILVKCQLLAEKLGGAAYMATIVLDKFGVTNLDELTEAQANMLLFTLTNRTRAKRKPKTPARPRMENRVFEPVSADEPF